jgi:hypothetical protein
MSSKSSIEDVVKVLVVTSSDQGKLGPTKPEVDGKINGVPRQRFSCTLAGSVDLPERVTLFLQGAGNPCNRNERPCKEESSRNRAQTPNAPDQTPAKARPTPPAKRPPVPQRAQTAHAGPRRSRADSRGVTSARREPVFVPFTNMNGKLTNHATGRTDRGAFICKVGVTVGPRELPHTRVKACARRPEHCKPSSRGAPEAPPGRR